jgi:hypothetical protein
MVIGLIHQEFLRKGVGFSVANKQVKTRAEPNGLGGGASNPYLAQAHPPCVVYVHKYRAIKSIAQDHLASRWIWICITYRHFLGHRAQAYGHGVHFVHFNSAIVGANQQLWDTVTI